MDETNEGTKEKAKYFYINKISVHIFKKNGFFHNGFILEVGSDFIILDDEKDGSTPIYFIEIKEIEKRRDKE
jgi:sRNA-binding regulator protein Hfq